MGFRGSWDLVSKAISTLVGCIIISIVTLFITRVTKFEPSQRTQ